MLEQLPVFRLTELPLRRPDACMVFIGILNPGIDNGRRAPTF
jgi:hypothetical protein